MRGKSILVLLALLAVLLTGCTQMSAEEIAKKIEEKYNSIKDFKGTLRVTTEVNGKKEVVEYDYVFKKPNKMRVYDKKNGILTVSNGEKMWVYDENRNEVTVMNISTMVNPDYGELVKDMLKRYDVKLVGSEKISGRECYVIRLTPKDRRANIVSIEMWVDKEFWYPLKIEYNICLNTTTGRMCGKNTIEYLDIEFNTGVSDDVFYFTPPKGVKIKTKKTFEIKRFKSVEEAQKNVEFKILKPSYTAGYRLKDVTVTHNSVSLNYEKNSKVFMIVESKGGAIPTFENAEKVKIGNCEGLYAKIYGSSILVFKKGDVVVTISGTIDKEELIKIAESME